jgi:hypothetical protein
MPFRVLREQELFWIIMPEPIRPVQDVLDRWQHLVQSHIRMSPQTSEVVLTEVRGDFEQPGPHIGVFRQFLIGSIGPEKGVLEEILSFRRPARQPPDVKINLSVVLRHKLRKTLVHSTALHASTSDCSGRLREAPAGPCP